MLHIFPPFILISILFYKILPISTYFFKYSEHSRSIKKSTLSQRKTTIQNNLLTSMRRKDNCIPLCWVWGGVVLKTARCTVSIVTKKKKKKSNENYNGKKPQTCVIGSAFETHLICILKLNGCLCVLCIYGIQRRNKCEETSRCISILCLFFVNSNEFIVNCQYLAHQ